MMIVRAKFRDPRDFLDSYQSQFQSGGLFVATRLNYGLGSSVVVDVRFPQLRNTVLIRGFVAWRRPGRQRSKVRGGIGVEFLASERLKRDFLLSVARGEVVDIVQRRHRRLPVKLKVEWRLKEARSRYSSLLEDIGEGGAFIRTTDFMPLGSPVILDISVPGSETTIPIEGRVSWTRHTLHDEGMGVEFRCRDQGGARRLKELVRRIEDLAYQAADRAATAG
ncbi:MAG: PilZ domain-containing protein [Deltaproteobacteria bacterium]|nr:PilZ domain-containing protein [Deltaproteobacteria bacterium]